MTHILPRRVPAVAAYTLAVLATLLAVGLRLSLDPWLGDRLTLVTLPAALAIAVWLGGYGPALVAAVLGYLACDYLFIGPLGTIGVFDAANVVGFLAYLLSSAIIIGFGEAMRAARRRAREGRELLWVTFSSIGDAVLTTDTEGRVTYQNDIAEELTGWARDQAVGVPVETVFNIVREGTREPVENPLRRALREGQIVGLANHTTLIARDGTEVPIDDSAAPIRDANGEVVGSVLVFRDVSDRWRTQRALERSERELSDFFENASVGLHQVAPDGTVLRVNQAELDMLGYEREEMVGHDIAEFHADPPVIDDILERLLGGDTLRQVPARLRARDGSLRDVLISSSGLFEGDDFLHSRCFTIDITDRKRAEEALRYSEERYRSLVAASTAIVWTTDPTGAFVSPQESWERYTGQSWEEHRGWGWADALHPDDREEISALWLETVRNRTPYRATGRIWQAASQSYRYFEARGIPLTDQDGNVKEWVGTCTDVTEQRLAEESLREADRRKDQFLATLAHELRNPLAPIRNAAQILLDKPDPDPDMRWSSEVIDRQARHMSRLLDDLLDVSRISHDKLGLQKERLELAGVIQTALETNRPLIDESDRELELELAGEPIWLEADPVRLVQVFSNLINNAFKYTESGGTVTVGCEQLDGHVEVTIRDDGMGIAPEMLPRVFDLFSQAKSAQKRSQEGLGIGLSLVRGLIELHGGTIAATSDGPGQGSVFTVRLPLASPPEATPEPEVEQSANDAGPLRILVVDDNRDSADSLAMLLAAKGEQVRTAYGGAEAIALAESYRPEVVLLDIGMPQVDGYAVCRHVRTQPWGRAMLVIALTGWGQVEDRRRTRDAGFDHHLIKPLDPDRLMSLLAGLRSDGTLGMPA